jgi:hypothetical protein
MRRFLVALAVAGMAASSIVSAGAAGGGTDRPKQVKATPKVFYVLSDDSTLMVRLERAEYLPTEDSRLWVVPAGVSALGQAVTRITYVNGDELTSYEFAPSGKQVLCAPAPPAPQTARFRYALYQPSATGAVRLIPLDSPDGPTGTEGGGAAPGDTTERDAPAEAPPTSVPITAKADAAAEGGSGHLAPRVAGAGPITGLVVDCRGLGIERSATPKILNTDGVEVYGTIVGTDEEVATIANAGIVRYYHSVEEAFAGNRVGRNPLIVTAVGSAGLATARPTHAVLLPDEARLIFATNQTAGFLERLAVAFIIDR